MTTCLWISDRDPARRLAAVSGWTALPTAARPDDGILAALDEARRAGHRQRRPGRHALRRRSRSWSAG
ncbi:hypothetical protein [Actinoplanes sp. CA-252034]|uniref:hypothetical protein n=1 Tax=Actinoplanes sp. CA-252034 TaxID=3239906 RepID=UPI003D953A44